MNTIRRAENRDIPDILRLLVQVDMVHHRGRPDIFKGPAVKYTEEQLRVILTDPDTPVFVFVSSVDGGNDGNDGNDADGGNGAGNVDSTDRMDGGNSVDGAERVLGYAFCILKQFPHDNILTDIRTLYIDDLCVDEASRGQGVGKALYNHVLQYARGAGCYNLTLNVWALNESARRFYEKCGLVPQKIGMETIL